MVISYLVSVGRFLSRILLFPFGIHDHTLSGTIECYHALKIAHYKQMQEKQQPPTTTECHKMERAREENNQRQEKRKTEMVELNSHGEAALVAYSIVNVGHGHRRYTAIDKETDRKRQVLTRILLRSSHRRWGAATVWLLYHRVLV